MQGGRFWDISIHGSMARVTTSDRGLQMAVFPTAGNSMVAMRVSLLIGRKMLHRSAQLKAPVKINRLSE